jgi:hypothetical protein
MLEEGHLKICPPRERDEWIMHMLVQLGYTALELLQLNWVRVHQEVLYLSDVMDARGTVINKCYEHMRTNGERFSFPLQSPPKKTLGYGDKLYCNYGMHAPLQRWVDSWKRGIKYGTGGTRRRRITVSNTCW